MTTIKSAVQAFLLLVVFRAFDVCMAQSVHIGGSGEWRYDYEPSWLPLPADASMEHAHWIYISDKQEVIVTYVDSKDDSKCLLYWASDALDEPASFLGPGSSLCAGVPHGLRAAVEDDNQTYLYHANNQEALHKTTVKGDIVWSTMGKPTTASDPFSPTWFDGQPGSPYVYMADGYGSSRVYVYHRSNGTYTGNSFGGTGTDPGQFNTCHSISWDWRVDEMVVSDRANHRLQYFRVDPTNPSSFELQRILSFAPLMKMPCNVRFHEPTGYAVVPFLEGMVGILDESNQVVSALNMTSALGDRGFLHPHDAHFLPSGDFVLATWNPGRVGYFRRIGGFSGVEDTSLRSVENT